MLVAAFEIQVGGPLQVGPAARFEHKGMGAAAVEPYVENVGNTFIVGESIVWPKEALRRCLAPRVDALFAHCGDDAGVDGGVSQILAGGAVDEQGDRHAPGALPRDYPIGPAFDHRAEPVAALFRHKPRRGDGGNGLFAQGLTVAGLVHRDEPLRGAAVNDLFLRPPRMRIAVLELRRRQQPAGVAQRGADGAFGVVELVADDIALALQPQPVGPVGAIGAIAEHGEHRLDAVRLAQREIVLTMVGRHMDEAGAGIGGDEVA